MPKIKMNKAMELALAARCAYADGADKVSELGLDAWEPIELGPVAGMIGSTGKKVILAFRGASLALEQHDTLSWLDGVFTDWDGNPVLRQYHSGKVLANYLDPLQTHWEEITKHLRAHGAKDKKLWIAGHGLGGALAALAGAMATWENDLEVAGVYTFGSPCVADAAFAANYPVPLYRFENRNDLITYLPPSGHLIAVMRMLSADIEEALSRWFGSDFPAMNLAPIGKLRLVNSGGKLVRKANERDRLMNLVAAILFEPAQLLQDHWIDSYCAAIDAAQ